MMLKTESIFYLDAFIFPPKLSCLLILKITQADKLILLWHTKLNTALNRLHICLKHTAV